MRPVKTCLCLLMLAVLLVLPGRAGAASQTHIEDFDVLITVEEDNTYHVVQRIRMAFAEGGEEHGAFEEIDLHPQVFFVEDGEFYERTYRVDISNVEVNAEHELSVEDGRLLIRIGDPDVVVSGQTIDYEISYDYSAGDDGFADFDMFYFAVVGNGWQMPIDHVSFQIEMPKEYDTSKLGFSTGYTGASGYDPAFLEFHTDGELIAGETTQPLEAFEGLWVRISLPSGYFSAVRILDTAAVMVLWTAAGCAAIMVVLFLIFRPRRKAVVTIEVSPPPELTSADAGYIIDGSADDRDVLSLLIYWADKGHLKIVEMAPESPGSKEHDVLFVKLHPLPPTANDYEILMFDALFEDGDRVSTKDLKNNFYTTIQATKKRIENKFTDEDKRVFEPFSKFLSEICACLSMVPVAFMSAISAYYASYEVVAALIAGIFVFVFGFVLSLFFISLMQTWMSEKKGTRRGLAVVCSVLFAIFYFLLVVLNIGIFGFYDLIPVACSIFLLLLAPRFIKRTELGLLWTGRILGLKRFIERAEKNRLEMLAEENPAYFYSILPFAYVLGVTDVWSRQFESLSVPPPTWYAGTDFDTFSAGYFTGVLLASMNRTRSAMTSQRTSSSGGSFGGGSGGFSGGGFSGGGFGGSGGGSW